MFLVRLSLCVCAVRGGDEKEPFSAGVTLVRKAAAQEEGDKDDKKGGKKAFCAVFISLFLFTDQPWMPLCPKWWKGESLGD